MQRNSMLRNYAKVNCLVAAGIISSAILAPPGAGQVQSVPEKVWEETVANLE